jgi:hypothetical protein
VSGEREAGSGKREAGSGKREAGKACGFAPFLKGGYGGFAFAVAFDLSRATTKANPPQML